MAVDNFEKIRPSINNSVNSNRPIETNNGLSEIKKDSKPSTEVSKIEGSKSNIDVNKNTDTPSKIEGKISVEVQNEKFEKERIKTIAKSAIGKHAKDIAKKSIPVVGGVASIVDAISRYQAGDYTGMFSQIVSSVIGVVPYVGTAAAVSIQGGLILRDVYKETYGVFLESDPLFTERKDAIIKAIKEIDIPALISESLSDIVKENAPEASTENNPTPTKPEPNTVETPKPTKEPSAQASQVETTKEAPTQVAEKSTLYSMFPSLESIFGDESPDNTVKENPIELLTRTPPVGNSYLRPNPTTQPPVGNSYLRPNPTTQPPVVTPPVPAPITPAPTTQPPVVTPPVPAPVPAPMPAPANPNKTPTTVDENPNRVRRRRFEINPSDVTEIQKSALGDPYVIKTAPTLVIYPFIGGDERRIKARTSERYNKEIRRVREVNYKEERATMEAGPLDKIILESNFEGLPNGFRIPRIRTIPPAPALGNIPG